MMHFYGMSDTQVLAMPIRRFWLLHKSIDRISAENDTRALYNAAAAQGGEAFEAHLERLQKRVGDVVTHSEVIELDTEQGEINFNALPNSKRDQAGFNALKMMGNTT